MFGHVHALEDKIIHIMVKHQKDFLGIYLHSFFFGFLLLMCSSDYVLLLITDCCGIGVKKCTHYEHTSML